MGNSHPMKKLSELLRELSAHLSSKTPEPSGQMLLAVDRADVVDHHPEAAHLISLGIHDACTRRGLSSSLVDIDEWVSRTVRAEGRMQEDAWPDPGLIDLFTGEPARDRAIHDEISWLLRHRSRLVRGAFASSGDAEVSIVLHGMELFDVIMHTERSRVGRLVNLYVRAVGQGHPGFAVIVPCLGRHEPIHFGVNAADDVKTWDHLLGALLQARRPA